ncbi:MAG: hypothetical protein FJY85_05970 [Deltaproteobacteria bacterium]|nr:hypothetical protein [Deltaproteobacteria bacterium]
MQRFLPLTWLRLPVSICAVAIIAGCLTSRGMREINEHPYPLVYEDDSTARFGSLEDNVFIEVRKTVTPRPLEHLAVHYMSLFPGGEIIKPGDREEYADVNGKRAYKVVFRTRYIRKRVRAPDKSELDPDKTQEGWTRSKMNDPVTGETIEVLLGPVIPQQKILYLVQGESYIYYILLRADGDAIQSAKQRFEKFIHKDIEYR